MHLIARIAIVFLQMITIKANCQPLTGDFIYNKVNMAVVTIIAIDSMDNPLSQGSGVVLNDKGWIVTNYHVFSGAKRIEIKQKNKLIKFVDIIAINIEKDILILKIYETTFPKLTINGKVNIGEKIYAIGSPLGLENSISDGIVSGIRNFENSSETYLQITAPISPGSSGGAIVNGNGDLIGISTWGFTKGQNLNFAIPIADVLKEYSKAAVQETEMLAGRYFYLGLEQHKNKQYDNAIKYFNQAIAINNKYVDAYYYLGNSLSGKAFNGNKDYTNAIKNYMKAYEISPSNVRILRALGFVYFKVKQYKEAIKYYKKSIDIEPNHALTNYSLGELYEEINDSKNSLFYLEKAFGIEPKFRFIYENKTRSLPR